MESVENLNKFKSDEDDCPTLVCTVLAAGGLDLDVDHVIMFDFPLNSIDYLHRTGRTARMGAKGKVTSLVAKRDTTLATGIEEAIRKNESLEAISKESLGRETARTQITQQKGKNTKLVKVSRTKNTSTVRATSRKTPKKPSASKVSESSSSVNTGSRKASQPLKSAKAGGIQVKKSVRSSSSGSLKKASAGGRSKQVKETVLANHQILN